MTDPRSAYRNEGSDATAGGYRATGGERRERRRRMRPVLLILLCAAACALLVAGGQLRAALDERAAARAGATYDPPALASVGPPAVKTPLVAVVGDEWASPQNVVSNRPWTYLLQRTTGVRVRGFASNGGAYVSSAVGAGGATFSASVGGIPPTSTVIVLFGGARDSGDPAADLAAATTQTIADAAARAPRAQVVVVGPLPSRPGSSAKRALSDERAVLRVSAATARATWVDPVSQNWFDSNRYWSSTASQPSAAGNERIATEMADVLAPFTTTASG